MTTPSLDWSSTIVDRGDHHARPAEQVAMPREDQGVCNALECAFRALPGDLPADFRSLLDRLR